MELIGKELKVNHTTNYSKFAVLPMNRGIDSNHVQKMIASIRKMGVLRCVIATTTTLITGVKETFIIDGQHLATALEREGMPIPYIEIEVTSEADLIEKMAYLNNSSKSWDLMNYVNAWKMIKPDYMKLFKWKNMYNIEISMLSCIANYTTSIRYSTQPIKDGTFAVTNPKTEEMARDFNDIFLKIGMADRAVKYQFLNAFIQAYGTYNHAKVLKNINRHLKTVKLLTNGDQTGQYIRKTIFNLPK